MTAIVNRNDGLSTIFFRCGQDSGFLPLQAMTMREWINELVKTRYKTVAALAKAIGMTESGFSRAMKAGTFEVDNCLRLADETGASAASVLRMANKAQVNDLIERLYGKAHGAKNPDAAKAADLMGKIVDPQAREGLLMMMRGYLKAQKAAQDGETPAIREGRHR